MAVGVDMYIVQLDNTYIELADVFKQAWTYPAWYYFYELSDLCVDYNCAMLKYEGCN